MLDSQLYEPEYVKGLFSEMSKTYERMNILTSFGFSTRWRKQCVRQLQLNKGMTVADWMSGMGEAWPFILSTIGPTGKLSAIDYCPEMIAFAEKKRAQFSDFQIDIQCADVLSNQASAPVYDAVVATFGLKRLILVSIAK